MEFRGQTAGACKLDSDQCVEIGLVYGATHHMQTEDAAEMDQMWAARRGCYLAAGKVREKRGDSVYLSDTCVPISKLAESVEVCSYAHEQSFTLFAVHISPSSDPTRDRNTCSTPN